MDKHMNPPESRKIQEQQIEDSFRQNASFAEKNLLNEGMFSPNDDDHDIKSMTRARVENMLHAVRTRQIESAPTEVPLGREGINQWIWENKVFCDIPTDILKTYLYLKKSYDAMGFYQYYRLVQELLQEIAIYRQIPVSKMMDEHILNEDSMTFLMESFATSINKKTLVTYLYKHFIKSNPQPMVLYLPPTQRRQSKTIHPKVLEYQKQLFKEGKAIGTQRNFLKYMNMFLPWLVNNMLDFASYEAHTVPILKIKEMHLEEFRSTLLKRERNGEYARVTIAECLYAIKGFFQFLKRKYGFPDPSKKLKSLKAPRYGFRELPTNEQITGFFNVIDRYSDDPVLERIAFRFMLSLGLRSIEVVRILWDDINFGIKTIRIHGKGDRYDTLPLVGNLYDDLRKIQGSSPSSKYLFGDNLDQNLRNLQNNYKLYSLIAGWEFPGGLHLFRHGFVTKLAEKHILPQALQKLSRVERLDTVSLYMHLNQKQTRLNQEVNKLSYT
jgi:integrase/recombinase XerD